MCWVKFLQPNLVLGNSVLGITPDLLQQLQLKGLILDVDETLVPTSERHTSVEVQEWLTSIKPFVTIWLVSNNLNERRIRRIAESLGVPYLTGAGKPSRRKLRRAAEAMDLPPEQVGMVGDRLFTDVLAGNRLGMFTILVEPMIDPGQIGYKSRLQALEVWISQRLGVSLSQLP